MGRQIQICTTDSDNLLFEAYLKSTFDCVFFQPSAPSIEQLEISALNATSFPFTKHIFIWNKQFQWVPKFRQTTAKDKYYLANTSNAPLIEFSKTTWSQFNGHGRIYWSKYFTTGPIEYDMNEFEKFYQTITKWFIKNAAGKTKSFGINIYYLKEAWERQKVIQNNGG